MKKLSFLAIAGASVISLGLAGGVNAAVVSLNFEGIAPYPSANGTMIQDFYNGGTSSIGTSGTNFGVHFGSNALLICLNTIGTNCSNTSRGGLAPGSDKGALFFLDGGSTTLDFAAGFTTGFSFNYTDPFSSGGTVSVYDGLGGTGTLLATTTLSLTTSACPTGYSGAYCPFVADGLAFSGTAKSIVFGGVANQVVFDDITFGSTKPGTVPEPEAWALLLLGVAGIGTVARARRGVVATSN